MYNSGGCPPAGNHTPLLTNKMSNSKNKSLYSKTYVYWSGLYCSSVGRALSLSIPKVAGSMWVKFQKLTFQVLVSTQINDYYYLFIYFEIKCFKPYPLMVHKHEYVNMLPLNY